MGGLYKKKRSQTKNKTTHRGLKTKHMTKF
jgi:hypothetical protein